MLSATVVPEMYRFLLRPKWLVFHLLMFAAVAAMVWLGFWQLSRLDERKAFNELVAEQIDQPPVSLSDLLEGAGDDPTSLEWRQVFVAGTYLPEQIVWFNRSQEGVAGDNLLSALVTDSSASDGGGELTVVVNRGFVGITEEASPPPTSRVEILARVRVPKERQRGELTDASTGSAPITEVRRIDLGQLSAQLPGDVAPVYLDLVDAIPALGPSDPVPVPAPTLDDGPHLSYAVQWFIFATSALVGWVLAVRRSIRTRRESLTDAATGPTPADSVRRDDDEPASSTTGTTGPSRG